MTLNELLPRLNGVRPRGAERYTANCPSHQDRSPSLSITETSERILLHCFSGCDTAQIVAALGLALRDLFTDAPTPRGHRPTPRPVKIDRVALAFRYELAALDRRLRGERIISAGKRLDVASLNDSELDRAMNAVAKAHAAEERAALFECVADTLRERDFNERVHRGRHTRVA